MNPDKEWPAIRAQLLRMLDGLWIAAAIFAAGLMLAFWAITQQVDYLTFGLFVESLVLIGWIVTRVRFLRHSSSQTESVTWAKGEAERIQRQSDAVSRTNGALLLVSGSAGLVVLALSIQPWSVSHLVWLAGLLVWVSVGSWLILPRRGRVN